MNGWAGLVAGGPGVDLEVAVDLRAALAGLPPRQRGTLVLRFYCDPNIDQAVYISAGLETVPINTATNRPGRPIRVGLGARIAITSDGKTLYAVAQNTVVPISNRRQQARQADPAPLRTPCRDRDHTLTRTAALGQPVRLPFPP